MKKSLIFMMFLLAVGLMLGLVGCGNAAGGEPNPDPGTGITINWNDEPNGTLTVLNNTSKDMVLFQGQTPLASNILGGVRALSSRTLDISTKVDDFSIGGYMILRGIAYDEYEANKNNLSNARIDYSAMATYGQGKKFRTEISPNYIGDYAYKVTNLGRIGMELRKNSPDGEKIGYLPSLATNVILYSETSNALAAFPVYIYYTRSTGQITTVRPTSHFESVTVTPRPASGTNVQSYLFPNDQTITWESIKASLVSPVAYITVTNNIPNQGVFFTIAGGNELKSQNGYDAVGTGEQLTFELESTAAGQTKNIVIKAYSGSILVPVRFEGADNYPTIKNGYDYTVTINFKGGSIQQASNYEAIITESSNPRDISNDIESL